MSTNITGNFNFLLENPRYEVFAKPCMEAERAMSFSPNTVIDNSRKALEQAVKWVYATEGFYDFNDPDSPPPTLGVLLRGGDFTALVGKSRVDALRKEILRPGNKSIHNNQPYDEHAALQSLIRLFSFIEWIDWTYNKDFVQRFFNPREVPAFKIRAIQQRRREEAAEAARKRQNEMKQKDAEIADIRRQLESVRSELLATRKAHSEAHDVDPSVISEAETRRMYIDYDLRLAGWTLGENVRTEVPVTGMEGNPDQRGFIDYVLDGPDGKPLAIIEAKRTSRDVHDGEHQAKLYADCLEKQFGYRPFIFLSNGYETVLADDHFGPSHRVGGFYSPTDLARRFSQSQRAKDPLTVPVNKEIAGRPYQMAAIEAVCKNIDAKHMRSLLVMATGTGKTRVSAALVDVLSRAGLVTNVLFLADRVELVRQAKSSFGEHLKNQSLCNLCEDKGGAADSRIVFSTYQTMINAIDSMRDPNGGAVFGVAHFDLIIIDEAHRSIFNKYGEIFKYFDGIMVGLTATPAQDVDRNTFDFFHVAEGTPTYEYDYSQALRDGFLVPFYSIEGHTKFIDEGITYDQLSDEDKERYEEDFGSEPADDDEDREANDLPSHISASQMNTFVMNEDTVNMVLDDLMENGIHTDGGERLGKTIIFAQTQTHAHFIEECFNKRYPEQAADGWMKVIVHGESYASNAIDEFKHKSRPIIAVSVDMLDTGVDVPEVVNLVFFKRVRSKIKFWQMIGRGTRTCAGLDCVDGNSGEYVGKQYFYIFDYCGNFRFFNQNPEGVPASKPDSLSARIFRQKVRLIQSLQSPESTSDELLMQWRSKLVEDVQAQISSIDSSKFIARDHREAIDRFSKEHAFDRLDDADVHDLDTELAPLARYNDDDVYALRFDAVMYGFMSHRAAGDVTDDYVNRLTEISVQLMDHMTIPQVREHRETIQLIADDPAFVKHSDAHELDRVREELRGLVRFVSDSENEARKAIVFTSLHDEVRSRVEGAAFDQLMEVQSSGSTAMLKRNLAEYVEDHRDGGAIYMIAHNEPVPAKDWSELDHALMDVLGLQEDSKSKEAVIGESMGLTVRRITGLDPSATRQAFSTFLTGNELTNEQKEFMESLFAYIQRNGYIEMKNLFKVPFTNTADLFSTEQLETLRDCIERITRNAEKPAE